MSGEENVTYTTNHELGKPARSKPNWDQDWHALVDQLEEKLLTRDVDSARSDYQPYDGTIYFATDTGNIYRGTGNEWSRIESSGTNPTFGTAAADRVTIADAPDGETDAIRKQELDAAISEVSGSGATEDAEYVTISDASADLPNSQSHADITADADLHGPKSHDHAGDSLSPGSVYLGQVSETPTDADIGEGNTAFYAKADGGLYKRPYGGTESGIGGGGGGSFDHTLTQTLDAQGNDIDNVDTSQARKTATGPLSVLTSNAGHNGIYSAQKPAGIHVPEEELTAWCFRGEGADPYAASYDHATETMSEITQVAESTLGTGDNHGPPSMAIDDNGTIHILFGSHDSPFQYARSTSPYDTSEFEDMGELTDVVGGTYPSLAVLDGDVYAFYRTGGHGNSGNMDYPNHDRATIARTQDGGDTWEDLGPVIDITDHPNRPCDVYVANLSAHDGELRASWFFALSTDGSHDENRTGVHHAAYDPTTDEWRAMDGTTYTSPISWSDINNGPIQAWGDAASAIDHYIDGDGTPHLTYNHFTGSSVEVRHAWYDSGWESEYIGPASNAYVLSSIRRNADGDLEIHSPNNTGDVGQDGLSGVRGGSYNRWTKSGTEWEKENLIDSLDGMVTNIQTIRNARDEFATLAIETRSDTRQWDARIFAAGSMNITTSTRLAGKNDPAIVQKEPLRGEPNPGTFLLNWGSTGGGSGRLHLGIIRPGGSDTDTLALGVSPDWANRMGMQLIGETQLILHSSSALEHGGSTTSDPAPPGSGVRKYLRSDTATPQYRMQGSDGSTAGIPLNDGTVVSDGDGTERQIWTIAAGASDPAEASDDDIIFEEE